MLDNNSEVTEESKVSKKKTKKKLAEKYDKPDQVSDLDDEELLAKLKKWIEESYSYNQKFIEIGRQHIFFLYVDQWEPEWRKTREAQNVPTMQFNHIRVELDSVMGEYKDNIPDVILTSKVDPQDKLDWLNGLAKQICYSSDAEMKYSIALRNSLEVGWGFLKAVIAYESNDSFAQCILIDTNQDFQVAFWDPCAIENTGADGDFCGDYNIMSMDDFKRKFDIENPIGTGQTSNYFNWQQRDSITIANIWYKDYFKKTLVKLSDDQELESSKAKKIIEERETLLESIDIEELMILGMEIPEPLEIVSERDVMDYTIKHVRFIENGIIERADWPGKYLPLVRNIGEKTVIDGEPTFIAYIQDIKDVQMLYNYGMSEIARGLVNTHKSKVMGTPQMVKGFEQQWRQPNNVQGMLNYNSDPTVPGGAPIFIDPIPFNQSLLPLQQVISQEINTIMGRFEESRGQESNAMSGVSVQKRKEISNNVISNYIYNNKKAIERLWVVIVDLLPHIYGEEGREVEIRDDKGMPKKIKLNNRTGRMKPQKGMENMEGFMGGMEEEIEHKVDHDSYSIEIKVAGNFDEQREKSLGLMLQAVQASPQSWPLLADVFMGETGLEKSKLLEERFKTILPPEVKAMENGEPAPPPQPNPMMQIEQGKMQVEMAKVEMAKEEMQGKLQMNMLNAELEKEKIINERLKIQMEAQQNHVDSSVSLAEAQADLQKIQIKSEADLQKGHLDLQKAHVVHNTHKMKQIDKLFENKQEGKA